MCMFWKCIVCTSNHCQVDRQRSSTPTPIPRNNTLGGMRESLDYWYRCMQQQYWVHYKHEQEVCTGLTARQGFDGLFAGAVLKPTSPSNPPPPLPIATGGQVHELVTMMKITTECQTTASHAPRFREICEIIRWYLLAAAASEWERWAIWKSNSKFFR